MSLPVSNLTATDGVFLSSSMDVWGDQMMQFINVFHLKVIVFYYGVVGQRRWFHMYRVECRWFWETRHLCPKERDVWLKLLDEVG